MILNPDLSLAEVWFERGKWETYSGGVNPQHDLHLSVNYREVDDDAGKTVRTSKVPVWIRLTKRPYGLWITTMYVTVDGKQHDVTPSVLTTIEAWSWQKARRNATDSVYAAVKIAYDRGLLS